MVDLKSFISSKGIINGSSSYLRQHQWLSLRNKSTLRKLKNYPVILVILELMKVTWDYD